MAFIGWNSPQVKWKSNSKILWEPIIIKSISNWKRNRKNRKRFEAAKYWIRLSHNLHEPNSKKYYDHKFYKPIKRMMLSIRLLQVCTNEEATTKIELLDQASLQKVGL